MREKTIRRLLGLFQESSLVEMDILSWGRRVRFRRASTAAPPSPPAPVAPPAQWRAEDAEEERPRADSRVTITSPMVGTFYRAPSPDAQPYVQVGSIIGKGQVVCIVEAMKLFNEIESEVSGKVVSVLAENAQPVEYGQVLFEVDASLRA